MVSDYKLMADRFVKIHRKKFQQLSSAVFIQTNLDPSADFHLKTEKYSCIENSLVKKDFDL